MKKQKFRVKKRFKILFFIIIALLIYSGISSIYARIFYRDIDKITIEEIKFKNDKLKISLKKANPNAMCFISKDIVSDYKKINFRKIKNNKCTEKIKPGNNYNLYLKYQDKVKLYKHDTIVLENKSKKTTYYLAKNSKVKLNNITTFGNMPISSSNKKIAYFDKNKLITGNKAGTANMVFEDQKVKIIVTGLINKVPKNYNYNRNYLKCGFYSYKEEKLLDTILKDRIYEKGYKTRAGVVEAARFLTLEFPYKLSYFSENGRLNGGAALVDGEGRYYHKGLYLTSNKFKEIKYTSKGPAAWGCYMRSDPSKGQRRNGLDCSGFTTWALYNGGFDPGDIGAHGKSDDYDLNSIGKEKTLTKKLSLSGKIKAGDLLGEVTRTDGHSAMVVGIDKKYYYVAEELWEYPLGLNINKYKKETFHQHFETVNLMDSYYKKQGQYTNMWY